MGCSSSMFRLLHSNHVTSDLVGPEELDVLRLLKGIGILKSLSEAVHMQLRVY